MSERKSIIQKERGYPKVFTVNEDGNCRDFQQGSCLKKRI